jgi:hypothetical protein
MKSIFFRFPDIRSLEGSVLCVHKPFVDSLPEDANCTTLNSPTTRILKTCPSSFCNLGLFELASASEHQNTHYGL